MPGVDDDLSPSGEAPGSLIRSVGLRVETFPSAADFLQHPLGGQQRLVLTHAWPVGPRPRPESPAAAEPVLDGLRHRAGEVTSPYGAMKAVAWNSSSKPFRDEDLLDIRHAPSRAVPSTSRRAQRTQVGVLRLLTSRDGATAFMIAGALNKAAAA